MCIDDVVKHLVHNKPLTCATEASDYIDAHFERERDYESRTVSNPLNVTTLLTSVQSGTGSTQQSNLNGLYKDP